MTKSHKKSRMSKRSHPAQNANILGDASQSSVNAKSDFQPVFKRRKLEVAEQKPENTLLAHFFPDDGPRRTVTLDRIAQLPRAKIPLVWFSFSTADHALSASHLLRLEPANPTPVDEGNVLVVTFGQDNKIYALERVQEDIFVTARLCEWIAVGHIQALATGRIESVPIHPLLATVRSEAAHKYDKVSGSRKPRPSNGAVVRQTLLGSKIASAEAAPKSPAVNDGSKYQEECQALPPPKKLPSSPPPVATISCDTSLSSIQEPGSVINLSTTPLDTERLRTQYFDMLYKSKASVAFFAKGPLARARTNCEMLENDSWRAVNELSNHYRTTILTANKLDIKYRETIPNIVRTLPSVANHEKLHNHEKGHKAKRNVTKLGKDGLFLAEKDFVHAWWYSLHNNLGPSVTPAVANATLRASLKDLQCREVQLQILVVLETIALERTRQGSPIKQEESKEDSNSILVKPSPAKKKQDLQSTLNLLVDKLSIWYTLRVDIELDNPQMGGETQAGKANSDKLRDFCTEVIKPFYGAKLPEHCTSISRKFGVSNGTVPKARPKLTKSASASVSRPGAAIESIRPSPKQKSLQRVLSDERDAHRPPTAGHRRSPSIPLPPSLKREASEPFSRPSSRAGIQKVTRFEHREVDLDNVSKQQQVKLKKISSLIEQKKELDAAISALRKPNRSLQAREFVDSAEKRAKAPKDPRQWLTHIEADALDQGVQVMATPKKRRSTQSQPAQNSRLISMTTEGQDDELSYVDSTIPSSTIKPRCRDDAVLAPNTQPILNRSYTAPNLLFPPDSAKTPTKPSKSSSSLLLPGRSCIEATPATSRLRSDFLEDSIQSTPSLRMTKSQRVVEMTALKKTEIDLDQIFTSAPMVTPMQRKESEDGARSIYDALGWDDDGNDDDDFL